MILRSLMWILALGTGACVTAGYSKYGLICAGIFLSLMTIQFAYEIRKPLIPK
ncbi:MAG: hypothetical protein Q8P76_02100 [bacterium]|nr:hypothetical protein [bacterium]